MPGKEKSQDRMKQGRLKQGDMESGNDGDGHGHALGAGGRDDAHDLCVALLQPRDAREMRALLADLCTPGEIRSLAERWRVARLLDEGALSYRDIHEATGVSTTTITRVARFLRDEAYGGYRLALERLGTETHGSRKSPASGRGAKIR